MKQMKDVALLLEKVSNTSSTKAKQQLLENGDKQEYSVTLRGVLYYCYNPFLMFGLSEKILNNTIPKTMTYAIANEHEVFDVLDTLAQSNINDELRMLAKRLLMSIEDEQVRNMVQGIMVKDLKLGVNVTTLNKVFGKDFIPTFEVQLAESYAKQKEGSLKNKEVWITQKYDGTRIVYNPLIKQFTTRNGKPYEGLEHLIDECDDLCNYLKNILQINDEIIIDGELVHKPIDGMNSRDLFSLTSGIARKKGKTKEKENLQFHVFDMIPLKEFQAGKSSLTYKTRRNVLDLAFYKNNFKNVIHVPILYNGIFDEKIVTDLLKQMEAMGNEGCMINLDDFYYCKRNKSLLKVKSFFDADVYVTDLIEGTGKNKNKLGAVEVKFLCNGKEEKCKVGSGFTDEQREFYWNNPDKIVNKVIVVNYFEVSKNKENEISLRFPTFTGEIRFDKEEKDITDVEE